NKMSKTMDIDFAIGVGDIPHKAKKKQYKAATTSLKKLTVPFYPIMGNEEHNGTVEQYLHYARKWNSKIEGPRYIKEYDKLAFVFASPDHGRDFDDTGAIWVSKQIERLHPKPVFLIVHGAPVGIYPEKPEKGIHNSVFKEKVMAQKNLAAVISGDLHMDMDRVEHSKKINQTHFLHIPALERTKVPDKTRHTAMFRLMTITDDGEVTVDTYAVGEDTPRGSHRYSFSIPQ
ncbi:MAG: metallophosphoesterase family protein, partial [Fibrobacterota bacterium]